MADKPLFALDVIEPRKILLKHLGYDWDESFNDFLMFRDFLLVKIKEDPKLNEVNKAGTMGFPYYLSGSTCCGINQLSLPEATESSLINLLVWGVCNLPPNFIYWGGESHYYHQFKLLEKFGFTFTRRPYNLVHNHFLREYQISYDYADKGSEKENSLELKKNGVKEHYNDAKAYYGFMHSDYRKRRPAFTRVPRDEPKRKPDVVEESAMPEMPLAG